MCVTFLLSHDSSFLPVADQNVVYSIIGKFLVVFFKTNQAEDDEHQALKNRLTIDFFEPDARRPHDKCFNDAFNLIKDEKENK